MRHRITYLHESHDGIDPKSIEFGTNQAAGDYIAFEALKAAREDRYTLDPTELTTLAQDLLRTVDEFHIKYVSKRGAKTIPPLIAQVGPGLHVTYQPKTKASNDLQKVLCEHPEFEELKRISTQGGFNCQSEEDGRLLLDWLVAKGTPLPVEAASNANNMAREWYIPESSFPLFQEFRLKRVDAGLSLFDDFKRSTMMACNQRSCDLTNDIGDPAYFDFDFSSGTGKAIYTGYWPSRTWKDVRVQKNFPSQDGSHERIEIGILGNETPERVEDVKLAGYITVLGEDTMPKPVMFSFSSRHHSHPPTYSSDWIEPMGLHPSLGLKIANAIPPKAEECKLYAHLSLPRTVFADRYQLQDEIFMTSKNLSQLTWMSKPVDLEAPEYTTAVWGSSVVLELAPPQQNTWEAWSAEIPLHLRYLRPNGSGYSSAIIPQPQLFWGCEGDAEHLAGRNPFARQGLTIESQVPEKNIFFHLSRAEGEDGYKTISVPVLNTKYEREIEIGTSIAIALGFGWVLWKCFGVWRERGYGSGSEVAKKAQAKKSQ